MSKIGKINISIPDKVNVVLNGTMLNIEGPLGKTSLNMDLDMFNLKIDEGKSVSIKPKTIWAAPGPWAAPQQPRALGTTSA